MTFLGRRSSEVYRVYSQDEFLDGAAQDFLDGRERGRADADERVAGSSERRFRRLAGAAMLAGAVGTVGGVVAMNVLRGSRRPPARSRGASVADPTRTYLAGQPTPGQPTPGQPTNDPVVNTVRRGSAGRSHPAAHRASPYGARRRVTLRTVAYDLGIRAARRGGPHAAGAQSRVGARSREAPVKAGPPTAESQPASRIMAVSMASVAARATSAHPEFGFER
jgi:hypothetical protein